MTMSEHVERLARRVAQIPFFLAASLEQFARSRDLDDSGLAAHLHCDAATLTRLRLCRNPGPQPPAFWQDMQAIASRFAIDPEVLAEAVRYGQGLMKLRESQQSAADKEAGYLMAARDKPTAEEGRTEGGEE